ncbi:MAG: YihY/virulence factor BrkB family protein [Bacteroidia bacterium]|nr:YihY/virulence factor BrkB family protein [Bacteroidia bacterium]
MKGVGSIVDGGKEVIHQCKNIIKTGKGEGPLSSIVITVVEAIKKYNRDKCGDKASALTYYTVLSIVPLAAMAFGIANAFGFYEVLRQLIMDGFKGHEMVAEYLLEFSDKYIAHMKGGVIAGVGLGMLFWSVMTLIGHTEATFNQIWGVTKSRSVVRKFSDYISIVLIAIIALVASSSFLVNVTSQISHNVELAKVWTIVLSTVPIIFLALGLMLIYMILTNTNVKPKSALYGGVVGALGIIVTQYIYMYFQIGISSNNAIYGSFAAVPLFLIWMRTMWFIVVLGSEVAYLHQNVKNTRQEADVDGYSIGFRRKIMVCIANYISLRFADKDKSAPTSEEIAQELGLEHPIVVLLLKRLVEAKLVSEIQSEKYKEVYYQPAVDTNVMTLNMFLNKVESVGDTKDLLDNKRYQKIASGLDNYVYSPDSELGKVLIKEL